MNTSIEFLRRSMAGALLATAITTTAVSLAATSHADDGAPPPNVETTIAVPAPVAPWLSTINQYQSCWRQWSFSNGSLHCG